MKTLTRQALAKQNQYFTYCFSFFGTSTLPSDRLNDEKEKDQYLKFTKW